MDNMTERGTLSVNVTATRNAQPIGDARVTVTTGDTVIEILNTDSAGQTITIDLPAPPLEYSQQPETGKPYSEYNVRVEAQGYETVLVDGVQLFPERNAIQDVRMNAFSDTANDRTIFIDPNRLWAEYPEKIPEAEVKPLPDGGGYIVLAEPVIPEYMVVHLGAPDDTSARNVWVPFKEYIANVASCEIYSTWPEQTLRANILTIQSFALNRVYTEWYRGRGYDFTITNNTAYDQLFSYGRNIFYNISNLVDELFTTYITKPGIRQPLFTQYCDGQRTRCNGLEQWGSKYLGDAGETALDIIRNYYGTNAYLMQAEKVQGVPSSYPGAPLSVGSTGFDVRTIQSQLNSISDNYPMIIKLRVDGIYGQNTRQAVSTFQQIFYLPVTGVVDFATWYEISNIFGAVNKLSELT